MFVRYSDRNKTSGCSYRRSRRTLRGSWRKYCGKKTHRCWGHFGQSLETERQREPHTPHGAYVPRAGLRPPVLPGPLPPWPAPSMRLLAPGSHGARGTRGCYSVNVPVSRPFSRMFSHPRPT